MTNDAIYHCKVFAVYNFNRDNPITIIVTNQAIIFLYIGNDAVLYAANILSGVFHKPKIASAGTLDESHYLFNYTSNIDKLVISSTEGSNTRCLIIYS